MALDQTDRWKKMAAINEAFTPSAPINSTDLFAGRQKQVQKVIGAIFQRGQHAIIFGERGVGKTSLSNVLYDMLVAIGKSNFQTAKCNCAVGMNFDSVWRSVFKQLTIEKNGDERDIFTLESLLPEVISSETVRETFQVFNRSSIVIIDEFDRINDRATTTMMADTVKTLSDHSIDSTLVFVGVADKVDELIAEHMSIERALVQIPLPRMSRDELLEIIQRGMFKAEMTIDAKAREEIANLSHGLPTFTHLLAQHAALQAIDRGVVNIEMQDLTAAMREAVESQTETIKSAYHEATSSPKKNLYREVLLACAMAPKNDLGYFSAIDVREPMQKITGKPYDIPAFSMHLKRFSDESKIPILQKTGQSRRFKYRFTNPLMEPFVVMKGLADCLISETELTS